MSVMSKEDFSKIITVGVMKAIDSDAIMGKSFNDKVADELVDNIAKLVAPEDREVILSHSSKEIGASLLILKLEDFYDKLTEDQRDDLSACIMYGSFAADEAFGPEGYEYHLAQKEA